MEKAYYDRYWQQGFSRNRGVSQTPPEWKEEDIARVLGIIRPFLEGRILDLGCGDGSFTRRLAQLAKIEEVIGCDLSEGALKKAVLSPETLFVAAHGCHLPFPDNSFDGLVLIEVVEHLLDTENLFREVNRVLKPGGKIIITTTDFNFMKKLIVSAFFFERYFYPTNPHIRFFTRKTLREILIRFGFQPVAYQWNGNYWHTMPKGQIQTARKIRHLPAPPETFRRAVAPPEAHSR